MQKSLDSGRSLSVKQAAEIMEKSEQFIRIGLQRGLLPFGTAVKLSSKWTYYISPKLFYEYTGYQPKESEVTPCQDSINFHRSTTASASTT